MKSAPFVSLNFLERIADPASRFHRVCLSYRNREITKNDLVAQLPHVAMLGDSVCMDIYISSPWSTFWRAHTRCGGNWFLDNGSMPPRIHSVSKRLEEITPLVAIEYAGMGAVVDHERGRQNVFRRILGTRNFSGQINQLLRAPRFPDLILISIGHNNVDWAWRCPPDELNAPERRLNCQCKEFRENYGRELRRVLRRAGRGKTSRGRRRFRTHKFRIVFQRSRGGRAPSRVRHKSVPALGNDVQIPPLFPSSLSAQFGSSRFNGERRAARNSRRAESRACGHGKHPVAIFRRVGDSGPQPRGITPSN
jgi:hypothetical protein